MKKSLIVVGLLVAALAVFGVGVAFAQNSTPVWGAFGGHGPMMNGEGPMHDYMVAAFAEKLGLKADDVEARITAGERMYDIAIAEGVAEADLPTFMTDVRSAALDAAVKDGVITQAQADLMKTRGFGRGGMGTGNCDGTGPQGKGPRGNGFQNQQGNQ